MYFVLFFESWSIYVAHAPEAPDLCKYAIASTNCFWFVIASILENIRELEKAKIKARSGDYSESGLKAIELKNKIFAVIGLGNIGKRVAEIAKGFNADVRYWSRNRKKDAESTLKSGEEKDYLVKFRRKKKHKSSKVNRISVHFSHQTSSHKYIEVMFYS